MITKTHRLPLGRQAAALGVSRSSIYYRPRRVADGDLALMRRLDEVLRISEQAEPPFRSKLNARFARS